MEKFQFPIFQCSCNLGVFIEYCKVKEQEIYIIKQYINYMNILKRLLLVVTETN